MKDINMKAGWTVEDSDEARLYTLVSNYPISNKIKHYSYNSISLTEQYTQDPFSIGRWQPKGTKNKTRLWKI